MLTLHQVRQLLLQCKQEAKNGLANGINATMPEIKVDIVSSQAFLGTHGNPAIFVNKATYNLLGSKHISWNMNTTIAIKRDFLKSSPIQVIGAIVHETGHAFNVAAEIPNTEANAYIYEIEVMCKLLATQSPLLFGCSFSDVQSFFQGRLNFYKMETNRNEYLASLVEAIKLQFELQDLQFVAPEIGIDIEVFPSQQGNPEVLSSQLNEKNSVTLFLAKGPGMFAKRQWRTESIIISDKMEFAYG